MIEHTHGKFALFVGHVDPEDGRSWPFEAWVNGPEPPRGLDAFNHDGPTPVLDAMFSRKEPKTGTDGTLSWTVDVLNPATGEDFVLGLKEITLPDGVTRPYSVWLSGNYPRALDGLTKLLSFDMRVLDPAWIGMKLRKLLDYPEPLGDFMAFILGTRRQVNYLSTVAYLAQLIIHRYAMLGILDEAGLPVQQMSATGIYEPLHDRHIRASA